MAATKQRKTKTQAKAGRPAHRPTDALREIVKAHAVVGTRQEVIADILGISPNTLAKHYRQELDHSRDTANAAVGGALYTKAISGDTAAMIFWMKTRASWRETLDLTTNGKDLPGAVDLSKLSDAALAEIVAARDASKKD